MRLSTLVRVNPAAAAFESRPDSATFERSPLLSVDSRKFLTARLFPVVSVFEVISADGEARLAVA